MIGETLHLVLAEPEILTDPESVGEEFLSGVVLCEMRKGFEQLGVLGRKSFLGRGLSDGRSFQKRRPVLPSYVSNARRSALSGRGTAV
ncbi:hypothetical protein, partial [Sinorhizobium meliloti]|uniref:hypothetical protein n=1 Tax=Rhizobium meliloti TaxID=382 RepID=UPI001F315980